MLNAFLSALANELKHVLTPIDYNAVALNEYGLPSFKFEMLENGGVLITSNSFLPKFKLDNLEVTKQTYLSELVNYLTDNGKKLISSYTEFTTKNLKEFRIYNSDKIKSIESIFASYFNENKKRIDILDDVWNGQKNKHVLTLPIENKGLKEYLSFENGEIVSLSEIQTMEGTENEIKQFIYKYLNKTISEIYNKVWGVNSIQYKNITSSLSPWRFKKPLIEPFTLDQFKEKFDIKIILNQSNNNFTFFTMRYNPLLITQEELETAFYNMMNNKTLFSKVRFHTECNSEYSRYLNIFTELSEINAKKEFLEKLSTDFSNFMNLKEIPYDSFLMAKIRYSVYNKSAIHVGIHFSEVLNERNLLKVYLRNGITKTVSYVYYYDYKQISRKKFRKLKREFLKNK